MRWCRDSGERGLCGEESSGARWWGAGRQAGGVGRGGGRARDDAGERPTAAVDAGRNAVTDAAKALAWMPGSGQRALVGICRSWSFRCCPRSGQAAAIGSVSARGLVVRPNNGPNWVLLPMCTHRVPFVGPPLSLSSSFVGTQEDFSFLFSFLKKPPADVFLTCLERFLLSLVSCPIFNIVYPTF